MAFVTRRRAAGLRTVGAGERRTVHASFTAVSERCRMDLRRVTTSAIVCCLAALGAACSSGSAPGVTIEVTISGDGVDQALVYPDGRRAPFTPDLELDDPYEYRGESMVVDLPWTTTVSVLEDGSTEFEVAAFNQGDAGELTCAADWKQADGDGTWDRTNGYLVSCSGDFSFRDDGEVRLDPGGRSVSFEARDTRLAEIAEAKRLERERIARVAAATEAAVPPGPVELDGWRIEITGVDRDAADFLEAYSSRNRVGGSRRAILTEVTATRIADAPGRASDIQIGAIGGYDLVVYDHDDDDCGAHVPDSYLSIHGLTTEQQQGDQVVFNTCVIVEVEDAAEALAVVSVFLGDDAPVTMRLPDNGPTANTAQAADSGSTEQLVGTDLVFDLRVVGASVDDVDLLAERLGDTVRPPSDTRSYVMVDVEVTNLDPQEFGPIAPTWGADWTLVSGDGTELYDWTSYCPGVFDVFAAAPAPEGGVDWNFGDDHLMAFPDEPKTFAACFEIDPADAAGSVVQISVPADTVTLASGL
jgi:hypothetical protein